jgi:hypothetical protein
MLQLAWVQLSVMLEFYHHGPKEEEKGHESGHGKEKIP